VTRTAHIQSIAVRDHMCADTIALMSLVSFIATVLQANLVVILMTNVPQLVLENRVP
jgi:hypothetical protein